VKKRVRSAKKLRIIGGQYEKGNFVVIEDRTFLLAGEASLPTSRLWLGREIVLAEVTGISRQYFL
jgi:hypothetical protein